MGINPLRHCRIVSGGQTGADRAALDFALAHDLPHGGWCPQGRGAEDGAIPARYQLQATPSPDPAQRTEWNVRDADATVIFSVAKELTGGSKQTAVFAQRYKKAWLHLSRERDGSQAQARLIAFLEAHRPAVLNIAGPRQSTEPLVAAFVTHVLEEAFAQTG